MLSSTSLLHGNCIFNRNNTVATQQGMKTYWLCKSYRITMCRARCITHQGRVISATGVHNHAPHMKSDHPSNDPNQPPPQPIVITSSSASISSGHGVSNSISSSQSLRIVSTSQQQQQQQQQQLLQAPPLLPPSQSPPLLPHHHMSTLQQLTGQSSSHHLPISAVQHMGGPQHMHHIVTGPSGQSMSSHSMLNSNNLMHQHVATSIHGLTNIGPILNPLQQHHVLSNIHPPPSLQITPVINTHLGQNPTSHNGIRLPAPPQSHQNLVQQSMHESPSPNHGLNNIQQTMTSSNPVGQNSTTQQNIVHQQNEDSNQQEGHPVQQQQQQDQPDNMMQNMEMASQQMTNQNYKMEHGM